MSVTITGPRTQTLCRRAFITTLLIFLALAAALVGTQLLGVALMQPGWVSGASDALLVPAVTAAVTFGLVGFVSSYLVPKPDGADGDG